MQRRWAMVAAVGCGVATGPGCASEGPVEGDGSGSEGLPPLSTGDEDSGGGPEGTAQTSVDGSAGDGDGDGEADGDASATTDASGDEGNGSDGDGTTSDGADGGDTGCGGGGGDIEFSYIWIANSTQGTVSKIDTRTAVEVGRYLVDDYGPGGLAFPSTSQGPSRTSVNLDGDVAVLDRSGGLTKFFADPQDCPDRDNDGQVDTATDENYLAWGEDECLAWRIDVPHDPGEGDSTGAGGPRAVQWTAPEPIGACTFAEPRVWLAFCNENDDDATVWLLDGADGSLVKSYAVPGYDCNTYGPYGGVVDEHNDFWFVDRASSRDLYRIEYACDPIDAGDCVTSFANPGGTDPYGISIDGSGRIWMAGESNNLYNYDPVLDQWTSLEDALDEYFDDAAPGDSNDNNTLRGLMADQDGVLWIASIANGAWSGGDNPGLLRVDPNADPIEVEFYGPETLSGIEHAAGVSIDVEGYVWLVDTLGDQAFKVDPLVPTDHTVVTGLQYPYTYSDMTGFALQQVVPQ